MRYVIKVDERVCIEKLYDIEADSESEAISKAIAGDTMYEESTGRRTIESRCVIDVVERVRE